MISTSMSAVVGVYHFGLFWMVGVLADITSTKPRRTPIDDVSSGGEATRVIAMFGSGENYL